MAMPAWWKLQVALIFVLFLIVWQATVTLLKVSPFLLPPPTDIAKSLWDVFTKAPFMPGGYAEAAQETFSATILSFLISSAVGILVAVILAWIPALERLVLPYVVGFQTVPRLAIAPLFIIWFGHGMLSKIVLATVVAFFPVLINTLAGLKAADPAGVELMASIRASRLQVFRYYALPNALPYIFAGLELALVFSLLGVIVAEFVGGTVGLGVKILQAQYYLSIGEVFANLVILTAAGMLLRWLLLTVRKRLLSWMPQDESPAV
jgi:NitT/TauT family transport system permease protein